MRAEHPQDQQRIEENPDDRPQPPQRMNSEERSNEAYLLTLADSLAADGYTTVAVRLRDVAAGLAAVERERDEARADAESHQQGAGQWYGRAMSARSKLGAALARIAAVEALHSPKTFDGYSDWHHGDAVAALGAISPIRHDCTDKCFETFTVCNNDGAKWPCSTAAALAASPTPTADEERA